MSAAESTSAAPAATSTSSSSTATANHLRKTTADAILETLLGANWFSNPTVLLPLPASALPVLPAPPIAAASAATEPESGNHSNANNNNNNNNNNNVATQPTCTNCSEAGRVATFSCLECKQILCAECVAAHKLLKILQNHTLRPLAPTSDIRLLEAESLLQACPLHPPEALRLFCQRCKELICFICLLNEHKDHQTELVKDVAKTALQTLLQVKDEHQLLLKQIKKRSDGLTKNVVDAKASMSTFCNHLEELLKLYVTALTTKMAALKSVVSTEMEKHAVSLKRKQDGLQPLEWKASRIVQLVSCLTASDVCSDALLIHSSAGLATAKAKLRAELERFGIESSHCAEDASIGFQLRPDLDMVLKHVNSLGVIVTQSGNEPSGEQENKHAGQAKAADLQAPPQDKDLEFQADDAFKEEPKIEVEEAKAVVIAAPLSNNDSEPSLEATNTGNSDLANEASSTCSQPPASSVHDAETTQQEGGQTDSYDKRPSLTDIDLSHAGLENELGEESADADDVTPDPALMIPSDTAPQAIPAPVGNSESANENQNRTIADANEAVVDETLGSLPSTKPASGQSNPKRKKKKRISNRHWYIRKRDKGKKRRTEAVTTDRIAVAQAKDPVQPQPPLALSEISRKPKQTHKARKSFPPRNEQYYQALRHSNRLKERLAAIPVVVISEEESSSDADLPQIVAVIEKPMVTSSTNLADLVPEDSAASKVSNEDIANSSSPLPLIFAPDSPSPSDYIPLAKIARKLQAAQPLQKAAPKCTLGPVLYSIKKNSTGSIDPMRTAEPQKRHSNGLPPVTCFSRNYFYPQALSTSSNLYSDTMPTMSAPCASGYAVRDSYGYPIVGYPPHSAYIPVAPHPVSAQQVYGSYSQHVAITNHSAVQSGDQMLREFLSSAEGSAILSNCQPNSPGLLPGMAPSTEQQGPFGDFDFSGGMINSPSDTNRLQIDSQAHSAPAQSATSITDSAASNAAEDPNSRRTDGRTTMHIEELQHSLLAPSLAESATMVEGASPARNQTAPGNLNANSTGMTTTEAVHDVPASTNQASPLHTSGLINSSSPSFVDSTAAKTGSPANKDAIEISASPHGVEEHNNNADRIHAAAQQSLATPAEIPSPSVSFSNASSSGQSFAGMMHDPQNQFSPGLCQLVNEAIGSVGLPGSADGSGGSGDFPGANSQQQPSVNSSWKPLGRRLNSASDEIFGHNGDLNLNQMNPYNNFAPMFSPEEYGSINHSYESPRSANSFSNTFFLFPNTSFSSAVPYGQHSPGPRYGDFSLLQQPPPPPPPPPPQCPANSIFRPRAPLLQTPGAAPHHQHQMSPPWSSPGEIQRSGHSSGSSAASSGGGYCKRCGVVEHRTSECLQHESPLARKRIRY